MNAFHDSLLHQLDDSITLFAQHRTPDAACMAAFDTLKQARALVARAFARESRPRAEGFSAAPHSESVHA
jgi:hypothetical protein